MRQPTRQQIFTLTLCSAICLISAIPLPQPQPAGNQELDVLQIPLANGKEIDVLTLGAKDQEQLIADRNKRTIGLLRELFPDITKEIDSIVNRIIAQVIRVAGPGLLNTILSGNRAVGGRTTTQAPDFDAAFDDDSFGDDDDDVGSPASSSSSSSSSSSVSNNTVRSAGNGAAAAAAAGVDDDTSSRVKIDLPTFKPDAADDANKQIDEQANRIISKLLRTLGPTVLRTAIQGNTANAARTNFDADFDDDDDDSNSTSSGSSSSSSSSDSGTRVTIELPTFEPDDDNEVDADEKTSTTSTTTEST